MIADLAFDPRGVLAGVDPRDRNGERRHGNKDIAHCPAPPPSFPLPVRISARGEAVVTRRGKAVLTPF